MLRRITTRILGLAAATAFAAAAATAQDPYEQPDESWISIEGTVTLVMADAFHLDYGAGAIVVEMDDGDRDADGYKLQAGDRVAVRGRVDDDLFENTTIEASSVYVENIGTYFFASAEDEEDAFITIPGPVTPSRFIVQGTVMEVSDEKFTILSGITEVHVNVADMPYNPLDDEGYQKIEEGDYVSVTGMMDHDLTHGPELEATSVVTLAH